MRFLLLLEASAMDYVFETQDHVPGSPDTSPEEQVFEVGLENQGSRHRGSAVRAV